MRFEIGSRRIAIVSAQAFDPVTFCFFAKQLGFDAVNPGAVEAENFCFTCKRELGVAVLRAQFRCDFKSTERLDLVLRRSRPDRIRTP